VGKRLELVTQAVPGVSQVAVLRLPGALGERTAKDMLTGAEVAARERGVRLQFVEARGPDEFDRAFSDMTRARPRLDGTRSKKNGSSWNRVGEKRQLKVREAALAAGGNTVATVVESG